MSKFNAFLHKVFILPLPAVAAIAVPSFLFVRIVLGSEVHPIVEYAAYLLSAYGLSLTVAAIAVKIRAVCRDGNEWALIRKIRSVPSGRRLLDDAVFRAEASLYGGLLINLAYVFIKFFSGIYYRSVWFIVLSVYYVILSVVRFLLLHHVRDCPLGQEYCSELRRYRLCAGMLLVLNAALSVMVTLVVVQNQGFEYGGYLIYVMAVYAFYAVIASIVNLIKFRRYHSPVLSAAKAINLTSALVSMLSLETAMIAQFDTADDPSFRRIMTAVTGFVVCGFVLAMAVYMIVKSTRQLKRAAEPPRDGSGDGKVTLQVE